jgi:sterol desaturase/sphingolipid hydroxylase (fatty acid hydroxylase superfamily)
MPIILILLIIFEVMGLLLFVIGLIGETYLVEKRGWNRDVVHVIKVVIGIALFVLFLFLFYYFYRDTE